MDAIASVLRRFQILSEHWIPRLRQRQDPLPASVTSSSVMMAIVEQMSQEESTSGTYNAPRRFAVNGLQTDLTQRCLFPPQPSITLPPSKVFSPINFSLTGL